MLVYCGVVILGDIVIAGVEIASAIKSFAVFDAVLTCYIT